MPPHCHEEVLKLVLERAAEQIGGHSLPYFSRRKGRSQSMVTSQTHHSMTRSSNGPTKTADCRIRGSRQLSGSVGPTALTRFMTIRPFMPSKMQVSSAETQRKPQPMRARGVAGLGTTGWRPGWHSTPSVLTQRRRGTETQRGNYKERKQSIRRVKIRILAHLALHLLALFFVVQEDEAVAEVAALDFALGALEQAGVALSGVGTDFAKGFHLVGHLGTVAGADHVVVERHVLARGAGVALRPGAADERAVDTGRVVQLGADDVQAARFGHARAELDVGAAAGHVRGDRDFARQSSVGDDLGFLFDLVRVEHLVVDAGDVQKS